MGSTQDSYRNTLRYAESLVGSAAGLAARLKVRADELDAWNSGRKPIPPDIFLQLVDIILDASPEDIQKARHYRHRWFPPDA